MPASETPKAHEPFNLSDIHYPVPFGMEKHLALKLREAYDHDLEWMIKDRKEKVKVNGLRLTPPDGDKSSPEVSPEELCQVLLAMAHLHAEEDEAEDTRKYRVSQFWRDDEGNPHKRFWSFEVDPPGHEGNSRRSSGDAYGDPHEMDEASTRAEYQMRAFERQQRMQAQTNTMAMSQMETTLNTILRANSSVLSEQRLMNEENRLALRESRQQTAQAQDRLFKMALALTANNEHQEQLQQKSMEMFSMGWSWYMYSMHQQSVLQERRHRDEVDRLRDQKKDDEKWSWVGQFAPAALTFGGAVLSHFGMPIGDMMQEAGAEAAKNQAEAMGMDPGDLEEGPPAGFETPPAGFEAPSPSPSPSPSPPYSGPQGPAEPPRAEASPSPSPSPGTAPQYMTLLQKARRFGELFSSDSWQKLKEGMNDPQFAALQTFVTVDEHAHVGPAMVALTSQLQMHKPGDECLSSQLSREQVDLANAIMQELQKKAGGVATPPPPSPAAAAPPSPPSPPQPQPPAAPSMPAGAAPQSPAGPGASGGVVSNPSGGGATGAAATDGETDAEEELEELRAFLAAIRGLSPSTREALESFASIHKMAEATDEDLRGIPGIGPVVLRRLRENLPN